MGVDDGKIISWQVWPLIVSGIYGRLRICNTAVNRQPYTAVDKGLNDRRIILLKC